MVPPTPGLLTAPPTPRSRPVPSHGDRPPHEPPSPGDGGDPRGPDGRPADLALFGMKWFVAGEAIMFGALVLLQCAIRIRQDEWPPPGQPALPLLSTGFYSLFLLGSGWTFTLAERELRQGALASGHRLLWITSLLATTFLALQGLEWWRLLDYGLTARENLYGYLFYFIIGVHGVHVACALAALLVVTLRRRRRTPAAVMDVSVCRLFWMFVVWVWPVLYLTVYMP